MIGGKIAVFLLAVLLLSSVGYFGFGSPMAEVEPYSYIPIKWAVIVLGGYDYYAKHSFNSIQRVERYVQARGVPYDLFQDDDIEAPNDNPSHGKYPLQYANGSLRYQVLVLLINGKDDTLVVNTNYIYSAVRNGTNSAIFGMATKLVPELLGISASEVTYFEDYGTPYGVVCDVKKTFDDGTKEYASDSVVNITAPYFAHTKIQNSTGKTVWYIMTRPNSWWIGMMNGTYGCGEVWYNSLVTDNDNFLYPRPTYEQSWIKHHFDFIGHAINFMFNQVEKVHLSLQGYKKWKGALVIRLDEDTSYGITSPISEEALKRGWVYDYVICTLGYRPPYSCSVSDDLPENYTGSPNSKVRHGDATHFSFEDQDHTFKFIIYNTTIHGRYDRIKFDFDENKNFSNDAEYGIFDNITYTGMDGTYYWCYLDNETEPTEVNFARWQPLRDMIPSAWLETYRHYGSIYGCNFGFHGWQHTDIGNSSSSHTSYMWDGLQFVANQTWVEEMYNKSRDELIYCFGSSGNGFEAEEITLSHPGNRYATVTRYASGNLTYFLFEYGSYGPWGSENEPGFYLPQYGKPILSAAFGGDTYAQGWAFDGLIDMVKTLYSVIAVYGHGTGTYNPSYKFTPYSDMLKPANPRDVFHFWSNARYMLRNTVQAYYKNNKITLEFKANSTLKDYVWRFPKKICGKHFNVFSDNRSIGKIKHFDEKYVYIEFSQGQDGQKLQVTYGTKPHIYQISSYIENITQIFTPKNLTLQLWNASGSINVKVNCIAYGQPNSTKINGTLISFKYNSTTKICSFNVTLNGLTTLELLWTHAPPNPPTSLSPPSAKRFDPSQSVTFTWVFSDPDPNDYQSAYRFQLGEDNGFASPIIDTGKVTSPSTQTIQTLSNNVAIYYWHVKTWDNSNTEGDWTATQAIIVDRLKITLKGVTDARIDVGAPVYVYFNVTREYDNTLFNRTKGTVYINGSAATWDEANKYWKLDVIQNSVGEWKYQVSSMTDTEHHITTINNLVGTQKVIWDKLIVTITPDATTATVGTQVNFIVAAAYVYDNKQVPEFTANILRDAAHFQTNNFTDTCNIVSTHQYTIEGVTEKTYGLSVFSSNSPIVTWTENPKTFIQLLVEWTTSNALIIITIIQFGIVLTYLLIRERKKRANT